MESTVASRAPLRRRSDASDPLRKVTFRLRTRVTEAVRALVDAGDAPSSDAFVEEAVIAALRARRQERVYAAYAEAAQDPAFVSQLDGINRAFEVTLRDGQTSAG